MRECCDDMVALSVLASTVTNLSVDVSSLLVSLSRLSW